MRSDMESSSRKRTIDYFIDRVILGDCMDILPNLPDKSVGMVLCDLPYNTTHLHWDKETIPLKDLFDEYRRVVMSLRAIVLFGQQPFTTKLMSAAPDIWRHNYIWVKPHGTNFMNSKYCPMKVTEDICVFSDGVCAPSSMGNNLLYKPIMGIGKPYVSTNGNKGKSSVLRAKLNHYVNRNDGTRYPNNLLFFGLEKDKLHPTQKPVKLLEHLIMTYTNPGDIVLDNCMGSGSTAIACMNTGRHFIGIEKDPEIFAVCEKRIRVRKMETRLQLFT